MEEGVTDPAVISLRYVARRYTHIGKIVHYAVVGWQLRDKSVLVRVFNSVTKKPHQILEGLFC